MFLGKGREQTLELLERAKELELKAREVAEGVLIGIHRSRHRGTSIEFSEHKPYAPGDEIRLIDWKLYAKTDRYFIKQFEDETRIRAYLLLDASGSMAYPPEKKLLNKFEYGQILALALSWLLLRQGDEVGAGMISQGELLWVPARSGERHFLALCQLFAQNHPLGKTQLAKNLSELASRIPARSLLVLVSDFLEPQNQLEKSIKLLRHRGAELILFQILSPEELEFPFRGLSWFEGLEAEGRILIDPHQLRKTYLKRLNRLRESLERLGAELEIDYQSISTAQDPVQILTEYLLRRAQRRWRRSRR